MRHGAVASLYTAESDDIDLVRLASNKSRSMLLKELQNGPANLGTLAKRTGLSRQLASHHLVALTSSGLIEERFVGSVKLYALTKVGEDISRRVFGRATEPEMARKMPLVTLLGLAGPFVAAVIALTALVKFVTTPEAPVGWLVGGVLLSLVVLIAAKKLASSEEKTEGS